jgi:hypothetical protein
MLQGCFRGEKILLVLRIALAGGWTKSAELPGNPYLFRYLAGIAERSGNESAPFFNKYREDW